MTLLPASVRSAGGRGGGSVAVRDAGAELQVSSGPGDQNLTLSRLDGPLAAAELKELLFKMADRLAQPEGTCSFFFCGFTSQDYMCLQCTVSKG